MRSIEDILVEASKLPEDQKLTLADRLLVSAEPEGSAEPERAWAVEILASFIRGDGAVVAAVAHGHREPGYWKGRSSGWGQGLLGPAGLAPERAEQRDQAPPSPPRR